jgi:hypothetical protein
MTSEQRGTEERVELSVVIPIYGCSATVRLLY